MIETITNLILLLIFTLSFGLIYMSISWFIEWVQDFPKLKNKGE